MLRITRPVVGFLDIPAATLPHLSPGAGVVADWPERGRNPRRFPPERLRPRQSHAGPVPWALRRRQPREAQLPCSRRACSRGSTPTWAQRRRRDARHCWQAPARQLRPRGPQRGLQWVAVSTAWYQPPVRLPRGSRRRPVAVSRRSPSCRPRSWLCALPPRTALALPGPPRATQSCRRGPGRRRFEM